MERASRRVDGVLLPREAEQLATVTRALAPRRSGRLRQSINAAGVRVTMLDYAIVQSEGGTIRPLHRDRLLVPVRPGWRPGGSDVTVGRGRFVLDRASGALQAVRVTEVRLRGSGFLVRAVARFAPAAARRIGAEVGRDLAERVR